MGKKTFEALMRRGFDSETANRLSSDGYSLNSLKNLDKDSLQALNISEELIRVILQEPRPPIPSEILNKVLYESRMTCCVCRDRSQGIIVHHIHEFSDSRSHAEENLVVLCPNHHGEAHTRRELQLNLTPERLREFKARWLKDVQQYDSREALDINLGYSYEAIKRISENVHHSIAFYSSFNNPKFSLKAEELPNGHTSRILTESNSNETIWELIQFPENGYPTQTIVTDDQLIISNFGAACILLFRLQDRTFNNIDLDSYEAGNLALISEKKKFGKVPVIRKYPPGDMLLVGSKLFVGQVFSEFVIVIDLNSKKVIKRIPIGGEGKFQYCFVNNLVYFASNQLEVFFVIDPISYQFKAVSYPESSLHIGSVFCHPDSGLFYMALHRTNARDLAQRKGEEFDEANCFIIIYDPLENKYISHISLEIDEEDKLERCWASSMVYDDKKKTLYIGMLGSPKNIYIVDTLTNQILDFFKTSPNTKNKKDYVDSLSLALYQNYLISVNRSNYELEIIERHTLQHLLSVPLGGVGNGPSHICLLNSQGYVSHSEYDGVIHFDLNKLLKLIPRQSSQTDEQYPK